MPRPQRFVQEFLVDYVYLLKTRGPGQQWLNSGSPPSRLVPLPDAVANITFFLLSRVCASCGSTAIETLLEQGAKSVFVNGCPCYCCRHINFTESEQRTPDYGTCEELADERSEVVASNVDHLLARISLLCKRRLVEDI